MVPLNGNIEQEFCSAPRLDQRSEHPIAQAIVEYAADRDVPERDIREFESITGKGVKAVLDATYTTPANRGCSRSSASTSHTFTPLPMAASSQERPSSSVSATTVWTCWKTPSPSFRPKGRRSSSWARTKR